MFYFLLRLTGSRENDKIDMHEHISHSKNCYCNGITMIMVQSTCSLVALTAVILYKNCTSYTCIYGAKMRLKEPVFINR